MRSEPKILFDGTQRTLRLEALRPADVLVAASMLRDGGTVAFPTETVYGLGANALDPAAVERIFLAKERPAWDPLIVHISDAAMLGRVAELQEPVGERVDRLAEAFWPGPLTMLMPRAPVVPDIVTAGRARVGVRLPAHPVARALIRAAGVPIAAPSANRFGHTSPTTAEHVLQDLDGRIGAVLDGGPSAVGVESTVLDVCESPMILYRPGAISAEQIRRVAGAVEIFVPAGEPGVELAAPESLPSPGVGLRHYAPRARLLLVGDAAELLARVAALRSDGLPGVMLPDGWDAGPRSATYQWGAWDRHDVLAQRLFAGLRALDDEGVAVIVCPVPQGGGIAEAIRDRLAKAALRA